MAVDIILDQGQNKSGCPISLCGRTLCLGKVPRARIRQNNWCTHFAVRLSKISLNNRSVSQICCLYGMLGAGAQKCGVLAISADQCFFCPFFRRPCQERMVQFFADSGPVGVAVVRDAHFDPPNVYSRAMWTDQRRTRGGVSL